MLGNMIARIAALGFLVTILGILLKLAYLIIPGAIAIIVGVVLFKIYLN